MANFFRSVLLRLQGKTVTAGTTSSTVTFDSGYDGLSSVTVDPTPSETKTQAAGTSNIDVTPSSGKLLSKVTVTPTPTETATATPSTTAQTITPSSGKYLSSVSVSAIQTQTKSATPSTTAQTITPDSGKYLTSVSVGAISTETKSQAAGTSNIDVTPTSGKYLTKVTITPQQHSGYYPTSSTNITSNGTSDLGASHNYRYVNVSVPNPTLSGDATEAYVYPGKTFYSNSYTKKTGSMTTKAAATYNTSSSDQTISASQYLTGAQTIKAVTTSGISAANIKSGTTVTVGDSNSSTRIANVTGTFTSSSTVSSGQTAAAAAQIKSGYSAWVNGSEVKGSYTEPTINNITPSNTSPVAMSVNSNYKMVTNGGYAIQSYQSKTPDTSGVAFDAGIVKMSQGGYAYSEKPASGFVETTLWTNSDPSVSMTSTTITLSQSIRNFEFLKVNYETIRSSNSASKTAYVIWPVDDFISKISGDGRTGFMLGALGCPGVDGDYWRARRLTYASDTTITVDNARAIGKSHVTGLVAIPLKIIGLNFA